MGLFRVVLKKTKYFVKESASQRHGRLLTRYLQRYVDEVEKAKMKAGENPAVKQKKIEKREAKWLLPEEVSGQLWSGGFLGESFSSGNHQKNKQRGWIKRKTKEWTRLLENKSKRRNDGFRFVLGMSPDAVQCLNTSGRSPDQALREIWRISIDLYRKRHGWDSLDDELAWLAGAHHDTDNTHLHILLFPTTKSGKPLRTNNARGKERVDDLNELVAITNIAAEIYWREALPFDLQSPQYQKELLTNPSKEPELPTLKDFDAPSGIRGATQSQKSPLTAYSPINDNLIIDRREDMDERYQLVSVLSRLKRRVSKLKGRIQLQAIATIANIWQNKKSKFLNVIRAVENNKRLPSNESKKIVKDFEEEFDLEGEALDGMSNNKELKTFLSKKNKKTLAALSKNGSDRQRGMIALICGTEAEPENKKVLETGIKLIAAFEKNNPDIKTQTGRSKAEELYREGIELGKESKREKRRTLLYRALKRNIDRGVKSGKKDWVVYQKIMEALIRGSQRVSFLLEARKEEANSIIERKRGKFSVRSTNREHTIEGGAIIIKDSIGKPWPTYLDPETVLEPMQYAEIEGKEAPFERIVVKKTNIKELEEEIKKSPEEYSDEASNESSTKGSIIEDESPLSRIIKIYGKARKERIKKAKESIELEPDINLPE
jgi:hypothetical protein